MSPRSAVIHLKGISKQFGSLKAVDNISLDVSPSEVVGFVGPNGAGKSTTIGMIMGFLHPSSGEIKLFGETIKPASASKHHSQVGYIAGDMALLTNLTGKQYLSHMASLTRNNPVRRQELISEIEPVLNKKIKHLSRGNKQKIALIAALQHQPRLLILDEPTSGLDPLMQETFLNIIRKQAQDGVSVFMSSHVLSEVTNVCSRVLFMKDGKVILDKSVAEIEKVAGKEITVTADKKNLLQLLKKRPNGIVKPVRLGDSVTFYYQGKIQPVLKWLATNSVKDVQIKERDLENIFHDLYESKETPR